LLIYGEQRGCGGRRLSITTGAVDLVVSQNNAPARLYRNETARPGLRVRVQGSAKQSGGIRSSGRCARARATSWGPPAEIPRGRRFIGSQDAATLVLGGSDAIDALVRTLAGWKKTVGPAYGCGRYRGCRPGGEFTVWIETARNELSHLDRAQ
jgi:hypothetical protein